MFGGPKIPRCWEKLQERCHCHTPFSVPQNFQKKTRTWEQCPHILASKEREKWQIDPILPTYSAYLLEPRNPEKFKFVQKWLRSDFRGLPQSDPISNTKSDFSTWSHFWVTSRSQNHFSATSSRRVTLWETPKVTFSHFWATLNFFRILGGGSRRSRTFTILGLHFPVLP